MSERWLTTLALASLFVVQVLDRDEREWDTTCTVSWRPKPLGQREELTPR